MSHNVTKWSRHAPILGVYSAFPTAFHPPQAVLPLSARRGRRNIWFCSFPDGSCSRRPASVSLRCVGGLTGFPGASRPPHHPTRVPRSPTSANSHLMHHPHQERDGRERLSVEALGAGSLAFCDMPFPVEHGSSDKPLVPPPPCLFTWNTNF